jgi:PPK2 family polyphosphate:nucleotide phosphotransferase
MVSADDLIAGCRVPKGKKIRLRDYDPSWAGDSKYSKEERKQYAEASLSEDISELAEAQDRLYAADSYAILMIFQAMDAAGKDGTIKHVMSGVNPQGCQVFSFKQPSTEELDHNFLWRYTRALPERGRIGIFNRSYYEEVLVVRVHPELVKAQRIPAVKYNDAFWEHRYEDINALERHLARNGTVVLKFFLHISREEQRRRFLKRLEDPAKHWKFSPADLAERGYWDAYQSAYENTINATSTKWAPWFIIPADHKWVTRGLVARILVSTIDKLNVRYPDVAPEKRAAIDQAQQQLEAEE